MLYTARVPHQTGVAISYALWALSGSFALFVLARIVGGVSKGNVSLSTAIVADVTASDKRSKGMVSAWSHSYSLSSVIGLFSSWKYFQTALVVRKFVTRILFNYSSYY